MGIEKKVDDLRRRVVKAEENASNAMKIAEESTKACTGFRKAVEELIRHSTSNAEAIVEHIAQLDTEKAEVVSEYRDELKAVQGDFNKAVRELESRLHNLGSRVPAVEGGEV